VGEGLNMGEMPVLFIGHGSPMNAIEDNAITQQWKMLGNSIPRPKAILSISAHWYTGGSYVQDLEQPKQIYDMYGFPAQLYEVKYPVSGSQLLSRRVQELLGSVVSVDNSWGIDHGTWSVLVHLYPDGDIPVVQLSVNGNLTPREQFAIGQALQPLRSEGILIFGSGNIVHNLRMVDWNNAGGFPWADDFDKWVQNCIVEKDLKQLFQYAKQPHAWQAVPTSEHLDPLFYCLGTVQDGKYNLRIINDVRVLGSMSMTSYIFTNEA